MPRRRPYAIALLLHVVAAAFAVVGLLSGGAGSPRASFGAHPSVAPFHATSQIVALRKTTTAEITDVRRNGSTPRGDVGPDPCVAPALASLRIDVAASERRGVDLRVEARPLRDRHEKPKARGPPSTRS